VSASNVPVLIAPITVNFNVCYIHIRMAIVTELMVTEDRALVSVIQQHQRALLLLLL